MGEDVSLGLCAGGAVGGGGRGRDAGPLAHRVPRGRDALGRPRVRATAPRRAIPLSLLWGNFSTIGNSPVVETRIIPYELTTYIFAPGFKKVFSRLNSLELSARTAPVTPQQAKPSGCRTAILHSGTSILGTGTVV